MNDELKSSLLKTQASLQGAHAFEREHYKLLLLSNPSYVGNLASNAGGFQPVLPDPNK